MRLYILVVLLVALVTQALPGENHGRHAVRDTYAHMNAYYQAPCKGGAVTPHYTKGKKQSTLASDCHSWNLQNYGLEVSWSVAKGVCFWDNYSCKGHRAGVKATPHNPTVCFNVSGLMTDLEGRQRQWKSYKFVLSEKTCSLYDVKVQPA